MRFRTRFAPSPTGPLHLGHAYSALLAQDMAHAHSGEVLLRIEDIDQSRARPEWEAQIYEDLTWLGIEWPTPVMRQSNRQAAYDGALDALWAQGLLYPCTCTRRDIQEAMSAPQEGVPLHGPDGLIYPGTCREDANRQGARPKDAALRLDIEKALKEIPEVSFNETGVNACLISVDLKRMSAEVGDVVLARRDMGTSYHLSVVVDDAAQGITHVVRGSDLFEVTQIHVLLQNLLDLPVPTYHHHRLIRDETGKRLAKRDDARAIGAYRDEGMAVKDILLLLEI